MAAVRLMFGSADSWPHVVEIELPRQRFDAKLREIETWLQGWEIPYRIGSVFGEFGLLRIRFAEEKFARAFQFHHGGKLVAVDEVESAMREDVEDETEYQRLAEDRRR